MSTSERAGRLGWLAFPVAILLGIQSAPADDHSADAALSEKARQTQSHIVAFDSHVDIPLNYGDPGLEASADGQTQIDLPKVERGLLKGASLAVFVPEGPRNEAGYAQARSDAEKKYQLIRDIAQKNPARAALAYSPADVRRIAAEGKFAIVLSLLNAYPLVRAHAPKIPRNELGERDLSLFQSDLDQIDEWYSRGVRILGFVHAGHNDWADSSRPNPGLGDAAEEHCGLSELGKSAVRRLNDLGVLIDVSQLSTHAFEQVLALTRAPVAATHSAVQGLVDTPRNLSDRELLLIQKNGGVVQIVAFSNYLRPLPAQYTEQIASLQAEFGFVGGKPGLALSPAKREEYSERYHKIVSAAPPATVAQFVDAIDYAVKRIGVDHVGISSDFNHGGGVAGWQNEGESVNVTAELLRRGYGESDIAKLWGGNFLRVWQAAEDAAAHNATARDAAAQNAATHLESRR
jgi:microsomal dipeptidase-like Zn-dependent dipeptidase